MNTPIEYLHFGEDLQNYRVMGCGLMEHRSSCGIAFSRT